MSGLQFAIIGAAAYVAPRHMKAIVDTGNELVSALDPHDNVGILDFYAPNCAYFSAFERFYRHMNKLKREGAPIDWVSVCTPNWLHDSHCFIAMRNGANVICEKPLVLTPKNLDALVEVEEETGQRVYSVMQLRYHDAIKALKSSITPQKIKHEVELTYITSRGPWFKHSWKGQDFYSGGHVFNIGIHFLDVLLWLFGDPYLTEVHWRGQDRIAGYLELDNALVRWFLSTDRADLPREAEGKSTYRNLKIDGRAVEFSDGFTDLHTRVYEETLAGNGLGIEDARPSIELAHRITNQDKWAPHDMRCVHPYVWETLF